MNTDKYKRMEVIFEIITVVAFLTGMRLVAIYFTFLASYGNDNLEFLESMAEVLIMTYMSFIVLIIIAFVFHFLSGKGLKRSHYHIRFLALIISLFMTLRSAGAISYMSGEIMAIYTKNQQLRSLLSDEANSAMLLGNPDYFYSYIVAVVILFVMSIVICWKVLNKRKLF